MRMLFHVLARAAGLLSLAGCGDTGCEVGPFPPSFALAFSTDTLSSSGMGFRLAEIRSAYLIRYATADFKQPLDTLRRPVPGPPYPRGLDISYHYQRPPSFEVPQTVTGKVVALSFRLVVPAASRSYGITDLVLETTAEPGACPTIRATRREGTVNGQRRDGLAQPPELTK